VARLMGDAILAFFGAPAAHEDDPQRAILAGLDIIQNIKPFREQLRHEKDLDFNVRVGINTGLVVVGEVGSEIAGEYTAMGDAVNVAARMEQTAAPGTVQIAHDTYSLVAPLFEFNELGGVVVKGKHDPVRAYQVLGRKPEPGSLRGLTDKGISSPLVGRESEFNSARQAITRLKAGQGGLLFMLGEAGIGKSRLITELRQKFSPHTSALIDSPTPIIWLEGQPSSYSQSISYWPFQQVIRQYSGIGDEDHESIALQKLDGRIKQLFPTGADEILPYLANMLALDAGGEYSERIKYLNAEALKSQVYRASWRFFQRLAEQSPLVLLFDDLHWMDASSAELVEHLMPLVERVPLLICGLSRPDHSAPAARLFDVAQSQYQDQLTLITLAPLTTTGSRQLVQNLLAIDGLPEQSRQMILEKADGNPFYLEEIIRDLIENGALEQDESTGRWQATQLIAKVAVPDTIQGLLIARIDRLDDNLKQVVRQAAVIGRAFLYRILETVLGDTRHLEQELTQLQDAELIQEQQRIPELEYIFKHALAQEAAYESILLQERREAHARVGAAIEVQMAERLDEFYGLLAYHYSAAEQWETAQEYLFKAGDQAGRMAADAEALKHYRLAIEAHEKVRGDDWEPLERAQLERKIGEALFRLGEHEQALTYLERALALLGEGLPTSKWGIRLALGRAILVQVWHRLFSRRYIRSMGRAPEPSTEEFFIIVMALNWIEVFRDIDRYVLSAIKVLNACERDGYAYGSAYLAATLATGLYLVGRYGLAEGYYRLATQYRQKDNTGQPIFLLELGKSIRYNAQAELEKSLVHGMRAAEMAEGIGDIRAWGTAMDMVAWAEQALCRLDEAVETRLEMISVGEESSDPQVVCWSLFGLGVTQIRIGQIDEAINNLQKSIDIAADLPDHRTKVTALAWLARGFVAKGDLNQALEVVLESQEASASLGANVAFSSYLGNSLSEIYLESAETSTGRARQDWLQKAKKTCRQALKLTKNSRILLPEALQFQGRYEWLDDNPNAAQKWWRQALEKAQEIKDPYFQGKIHFEIGQRTGDRAHLLKAESILEEIGSAFYLERTRTALANLGDDQVSKLE